MSKSLDTASELKKFCKLKGADLVGIADLESLRQGLPVFPEDLLDPYSYAVSVGVRLDDSIIDALGDRPTPDYARHYREINNLLNGLTAGVVQWIRYKGFKVIAIPASHLVNETRLVGNISHKAVARMAGLGWQGKSLLIVSPEYGPRIRLATVLTGMPLKADMPIENRCGGCTECADVCPAAAIKNVSTGSHYMDREDAVDIRKCNAKLFEFKALPGIGARICGLCIKACPYGK